MDESGCERWDLAVDRIAEMAEREREHEQDTLLGILYQEAARINGLLSEQQGERLYLPRTWDGENRFNRLVALLLSDMEGISSYGDDREPVLILMELFIQCVCCIEDREPVENIAKAMYYTAFDYAKLWVEQVKHHKPVNSMEQLAQLSGELALEEKKLPRLKDPEEDFLLYADKRLIQKMMRLSQS